MNSIEKITKRITEEAEGYASEAKKSAKERSESITADANKKAEEIKRSYAERAAKESNAIITRAASSADILERNILLDAKSVIIDGVYEKAEKAFLETAPERYLDFLIRTLRGAIEFLSVAQDGDEDESEEEKSSLYVLTLNARDCEKFGKKLLMSVKAEVSGQGRDIELSESFGDFSGGLNLSLGSTAVSATTKALLKAAREKTEAKVYGILFSQSEGRQGLEDKI